MSFYTISAEATATKVNDAGEDGQDAEGGKREGQGDAGGDWEREGTIKGTQSIPKSLLEYSKYLEFFIVAMRT